MLKQQTVSTALGQLTISSLTLGELRQLDSLFHDSSNATAGGVTSLLRYLPVIFAAIRKVHQDLTLEQLENGLTFDDFNVLFSAMLEVSGLKKSVRGGTDTGTGIADWPFLYGHIATATGWTFPQIEQLTLWDVNDLLDYWRDYPPTHVLVAAYLLGNNTRHTGRRDLKSNASLLDLKQLVVSSGGSIKREMPEHFRRP